MHVELLELRRRRQDDVGVVAGVGQEDLVHDREEIAAAQALAQQGVVRRHRDRVGDVDEEGLDRRVVELGEGLADLRHVDAARRPRRVGQEMAAVECGEIDGMRAGLVEQDAARRVAPGASQCRQAGDGAHRVATAGMALQAEVDADGGGPVGAVVAREATTSSASRPVMLRDPLRRESGARSPSASKPSV